MPHRAVNVLLAAAGVLAVLALVLVGADLGKASRRGAKWKRRLLAAGLLVLGMLGVDGGTTRAEARPAAGPAAARPAAPPAAREPWREFVEAWDEARRIVEGRLGERPVMPEDRPALLARLGAAERRLDTLQAAGRLAGPEVALLKAEFAPLVEEVRRVTAPPPPGAGSFSGPWSAAESLRRLQRRLPWLEKLAAEPKVSVDVRDEVLRTTDWDVVFLRGRHGRALLAADRRPRASELCGRMGKVVAGLRSLPGDRLRRKPEPPTTSPGGIFEDESGVPERDDLAQFLVELARLKTRAYRPTLLPSHGAVGEDVVALLGARRRLSKLRAGGELSRSEAELLELELADAADGVRRKALVGDDGRLVVNRQWAAAAREAHALLRARVGPLEELAKAGRANAEILRHDLREVAWAAGHLLELDGLAWVPALEQIAAEKLARRAEAVVERWHKLLAARAMEPPDLWPRQAGGAFGGLFGEPDEPAGDDAVSVLARRIYGFEPDREARDGFDAGGRWTSLFTEPMPLRTPEEVLRGYGKEIDRLLGTGKLHRAEAALLRAEVRRLVRGLARSRQAVADEAPRLPEPYPPTLVARIAARVPLLRKLAAERTVSPATIETGLEALQADVCRLEQYVADARRELAPRPAKPLREDAISLPAGPGDSGWDMPWECFLRPDATFASREEGKRKAAEQVEVAGRLVQQCKVLLSRIRQAGPPLKGADLAGTPEWRRVSRIWRQAAQAASLATPFNSAGRQRLMLRLGLAMADVAVLGEAGLLTPPEAGLLRTNLETYRDFLRDRRTLAGRATLCYGSGPSVFPRSPGPKALARRLSLLEKLAASRKLRAEVCAKALSVIEREASRKASLATRGSQNKAELLAKDRQLRARTLKLVRRLRERIQPPADGLAGDPRWRRVVASLRSLYAACKGEPTVRLHLRAIYLTSVVSADVADLRGRGGLSAAQADLLDREAHLAAARSINRPPVDVRTYEYTPFRMYGYIRNILDESSYEAMLPYHVVLQTGLLRAARADGGAGQRELVEMIAPRLRADVARLERHFAAGNRVVYWLQPYCGDPSPTMEKILRDAKAALKALEAERPGPG